MDEFVMTIKKHKETIVIALAILMFILFGFCPAIDIIGMAKIGGLKLLFEGSGLGFARFLSIFVLLAPMFVALGRSVDLKLTGKLAELKCSPKTNVTNEQKHQALPLYHNMGVRFYFSTCLSMDMRVLA